MWIWMSPNHIKAIWKVLVAESWIFKKLFSFEVMICICFDTGTVMPVAAVKEAVLLNHNLVVWMESITSGMALAALASAWGARVA